MAVAAPVSSGAGKAQCNVKIDLIDSPALSNALVRMPTRPACRHRVLFVHHSSDLYGSDRVLLEVVHALRLSGGEPIVVLPGGGPLVQALRDRGIEVHPVEPMQVMKLSRSILTSAGVLRLFAAIPRALATLDRCVAGRSIELVHTNTLAVLAGALWARRRRVAHLWHVHEIVEHPRAAARAFPWLVRMLADSVVCNSFATQRWLLSAEPSLACRSRVIWNGVSPREGTVDPKAMRALHQDFRPHGASLAMGLVGRINRWKGQEQLLAAAELLHARGISDFSIVFVGTAPTGQEHLEFKLRRRIAASPMASRVVMAGFMPDVAPAYAALDIVCVPSTEAEPFGLVAVEAMAAGRPVVASSIGGLPEIVIHGRTGLLHPPGDAPALAEHLASLLADSEQRAALGHEGRRRFEAEFTVGAMTRRFLDLFAVLARSTV